MMYQEHQPPLEDQGGGLTGVQPQRLVDGSLGFLCIVLHILVILCHIDIVVGTDDTWYPLSVCLFIILKDSPKTFTLEIRSVVAHLLVDFCPGILQSNGLVEYRMLLGSVGICHEVTDTLELQIVTGHLLSGILLYVTVVDDGQ